MSHEPNLVVSRYADLRYEPITRFLTPITAYLDAPLVSLEESIKLVSHFFNGIEGYVWIAKENSKNPANGLTMDESASIQLYTMQFDSGPSLYDVLNEALRNENRQLLKPWAPFLKLLLTALCKLPSCAQTVWRGVRGENLSPKYPTGSRFAWWGVSSCTAAIETLENDIFLGKTGLRTLFSIECKHGKSIEAHSYFKREKEIILLPGSYFEVVSQLNPSADLHIIHLKEIDPPVPLVKLPLNITQHFAHVKESSDNLRAENRIPILREALPNLTAQETRWRTGRLQFFSPSLSKDELPIEGRIKYMKSEEQIKDEIKHIKCREMSIEQKIVILKSYEILNENTHLPVISFEDQENVIMIECEHLKDEEEHIEYEVKRMEQHKIYLENEIQSIKSKITENKTKLLNRANEPKELQNELKNVNCN